MQGLSSFFLNPFHHKKIIARKTSPGKNTIMPPENLGIDPNTNQLPLFIFPENNPFDRLAETRSLSGIDVPVYVGEFWTARQRTGHSIHEISYRACYKPQLPAFFLERHCRPGDLVYDPFMGRGTTLIEARLHGCAVMGNDASPLSRVLAYPRLNVPSLNEIEARLSEVTLRPDDEEAENFLTFFHQKTLDELLGWKAYFKERIRRNQFDRADAWIRMIACNRLTGHSNGFFSVYTLPPNQAASFKSQEKINLKRKQTPEYRNTRALILKKSRRLLRHPLPANYNDPDPRLFSESADSTPRIEDNSVKLVVTSPPFLDTVDYLKDNWMRNWFCGFHPEQEQIWQIKSLEGWIGKMKSTLRELKRILHPDGRIAFEVGEVRKGSLLLENTVAEAGVAAGLAPDYIMINSQEFTKTANCWGVSNNQAGTNSNRLVVFRKGH